MTTEIEYSSSAVFISLELTATHVFQSTSTYIRPCRFQAAKGHLGYLWSQRLIPGGVKEYLWSKFIFILVIPIFSDIKSELSNNQIIQSKLALNVSSQNMQSNTSRGRV